MSLVAPLLLAAALGAPVRYAPGAHPPDRPERPVSVIAFMGFDYGFTELLKLKYSDGSSETLGANEGFYLSAGVAFLKLPLELVTLDTAATIGVKGWNVGADNGKMDYLAFPLELVERAATGQFRLGAGLSYSLSPRLKATGVLAGYAVGIEDSLGLTLQAEWIGRRSPGEGGAVIGLRYLVQRLTSKATGHSVDASALGMTFGLEY